MTSWKDTYAELGAEVDAAQTAALAVFMAAATDSAIGAGPAGPGEIARSTWIQTHALSNGDVTKLMTVTWRAISRAILTHIGPVSGDGSILISIQMAGEVPQLDLRSASGVGSLSTKLPLENGVADPGNTTSGRATAEDHVHPSQDTAGGDLYCVDAIAAETITYYATPTIGLDAQPTIAEGAPDAWDMAIMPTTGGNLGGY